MISTAFKSYFLAICILLMIGEITKAQITLEPFKNKDTLVIIPLANVNVKACLFRVLLLK